MNSFMLGLISDTHGYLRPEAITALQGSHAIIHAGDIGETIILDELKSIAPSFAIRGNVDMQPWTLALPQTAIVELQDVSIYVLHNLKQLDLNPAASGFHIVVSGHTHNPESLARRRFLPQSRQRRAPTLQPPHHPRPTRPP